MVAIDKGQVRQAQMFRCSQTVLYSLRQSTRTIIGRLWLVRSFFEGLRSNALRKEVCRRLVGQTMGASSVICREGEIGETFYVVVSGVVSVQVKGNEVATLRDVRPKRVRYSRHAAGSFDPVGAPGGCVRRAVAHR